MPGRAVDAPHVRERRRQLATLANRLHQRGRLMSLRDRSLDAIEWFATKIPWLYAYALIGGAIWALATGNRLAGAIAVMSLAWLWLSGQVLLDALAKR